jgi:SAM-dependent methyltransferase
MHGADGAELGPALPSDYDTDPGRFAANQAATAAFSRQEDVHPAVARRLTRVGCGLVLDVGGGNGVLARELAKGGVRAVTIDRAGHLSAAPPPVVRADALMLPFGEDSFGGAAALWMLYHLPSPQPALAEIRRCLWPGGLLAVSAPSRYNDPEFKSVLPRWGQALSFDAENGPGQVATVFGDVEVVAWDEPLVLLGGPADIALFLRGRGLTDGEARAAAKRFETPLTVTKRGMLTWARK